MKRFRPTPVLGTLLAALFAGCAATSESFLAEQLGYSVTRGRITKIENLHSDEIEPLADGVALTAGEAGLVSLRFEDERTQDLEIAPGMIVLFAADQDYVLQPADGGN